MQLTQSILHQFGCTCSTLIGYGVEDGKPEVWSEKIISPDEDCVFHSPKLGGTIVYGRGLEEFQGSSNLVGRRVVSCNGKVPATNSHKTRD